MTEQLNWTGHWRIDAFELWCWRRLLIVPWTARRFNQSILRRSVQFSRSVVSNSLRPHESQHTRPPCPSPTPGVHSGSRSSSQWCHPAISSSVVSFSSCPQSLPASGSFPMSQLFPWGGQSIGVSASTSVLPMNTQDWSPLGWTGWIFLQSKGLSRVFSNTTVQKHQFFSASDSNWGQFSFTKIFSLDLSSKNCVRNFTIAKSLNYFMGGQVRIVIQFFSHLKLCIDSSNNEQLNSISNICSHISNPSRAKENHSKSFAFMFNWLLMLLPMSSTPVATLCTKSELASSKWLSLLG